jgi:predicted transposase YbfD/YdcC
VRRLSVAAVEPTEVGFAGARQVVAVTGRSTHKKSGVCTTLTRQFVSSRAWAPKEAAALAGAIRGHWSVENRNHRRRDVLWGEDRCRLRDPNGASALALLRTALLALVIPEDRPAPELFATVIAHPDYGFQLLRSK